jgi:AhpD family alkylhydroperoxidase
VAPARSWQRLSERYPEVVAAYDALSDVCRSTGPLDEPVVALVKLAVSVGRGAQRTVHAHAKKALRAGADPEALRQVVLAALPTIGLPAALDALRWVDESISESEPVTSGRCG